MYHLIHINLIWWKKNWVTFVYVLIEKLLSYFFFCHTEPGNTSDYTCQDKQYLYWKPESQLTYFIQNTGCFTRNWIFIHKCNNRTMFNRLTLLLWNTVKSQEVLEMAISHIQTRLLQNSETSWECIGCYWLNLQWNSNTSLDIMTFHRKQLNYLENLSKTASLLFQLWMKNMIRLGMRHLYFWGNK